jgi:hypothetical protein
MVGNYRRSPKSLKDLCIDSVCRSLPDLDGELPAGLPQELVDATVKSLIKHSALNSTTLRALKNCEIGELCLAGCRGVRDEWFKPLSSQPTTTLSPRPRHYNPPPDLCCASFDQDGQPRRSPLEVDCGSGNASSSTFVHHPYHKSASQHHILQARPMIPKLAERYQDEDASSSSSSTGTFLSASSTHLADMTADAEDETEGECGSRDAHHNSMKSSEGAGSRNDDSRLEEEAASGIPYFDLGISSMTANLTVLDVRGSQRLTDRGLLQLSSLRSLEVAKLDHCHSIVGKGLVAFASSSRLHTLSLANCRRLTDEAITNISHLPAIEALSLDGCRCITDQSLVAMSNMYALRKLDLSQCDLITDEGIGELRGLQQLEELSLGWCRSLSDDGIRSLCEHPGRAENLRVLRLARCDLYGGEGLGGLANLVALEELDLNGCSSIGSASLGGVLGHLKNLRSLDVSYCPGIL